MSKKEKKQKVKGLWSEFKKFISRGNILDMAVGVVIGSAFSAIVTALVAILLSVCTWAVPGGLSGLITVLPAANDLQRGMGALMELAFFNGGNAQSFNAANLQEIAEQLAISLYGAEDGSTVSAIEAAKTSILSNYTLHGGTYVYNSCAVIDWGNFINAIISFLIIAITLFTIVKVVNALSNKRKEYEAKLQEEYYKLHPEERPLPPEEVPPAPTEVELLTKISEQLEALNTQNKVTK